MLGSLLQAAGMMRPSAAAVYALDFNGADESASVGGGLPSIGTFPFSVSLWFLFRGTASAARLYRRDDGVDGWSAFITSAGAGKVEFRKTGTTVQHDVGTVTEDVWHHLVAVHDRNGGSGLRVQAWLDGVDTGASTGGSGSPGSNTATLYLAQSGSGSQFFDGQIRDFAVFNKALDGTDVAGLFAETETPNTVGDDYLWVKPDPAVDDLSTAGGLTDFSTAGGSDMTCVNMTNAANIVVVP